MCVCMRERERERACVCREICCRDWLSKLGDASIMLCSQNFFQREKKVPTAFHLHFKAVNFLMPYFENLKKLVVIGC